MSQHRVVVLTDLHLRSNYLYGYLDKQVETLLYYANRKLAHTVVINGDIFHSRNPKGRELLAFQKLLDGIKAKQIIINRGNHDTLVRNGASDTSLSLFEADRVKVVSDTEVVAIGGVEFAIIPHYDDEDRIIQDIKKTAPLPIFGHFGFNGSLVRKGYTYDSVVRKNHFEDRLTFLGHIHKPYKYGENVYVLGTQYATSFGEANTTKYIHELLISDGKVEVVKSQINTGIKHIVGKLDEIAALDKKHKFKDFFTILRIKVDTLDTFAEKQIKEDITKRYDLAHMDVVFEDVFQKAGVARNMQGSVLAFDDAMIEQYITDTDTIFNKTELMDALKLIQGQ